MRVSSGIASWEVPKEGSTYLLIEEIALVCTDPIEGPYARLRSGAVVHLPDNKTFIDRIITQMKRRANA